MPDESIYQGHRLTRQGMERVLAENGSVLHNGRVIVRGEDLPSEADLAKGGDRRQVNAARESLDAQIAALHAQRRSLDDDAPAPPQPDADPGPAEARPAGETKSDAEARANAEGTVAQERRETTATADSPAVDSPADVGVDDSPKKGGKK